MGSYASLGKLKKENYNKRKVLTEKEKREILQKQFKHNVGYDLNLDAPQTFNEKIMWYKLYYQDPLITKCCDKYAVKDYVIETIGEQYIIPNIGKWEDPEQIDFEQLPDKFALKVNWSSGYNIICSDKSQLNIEKTKEQLKKWIEPDRNSYYQLFNWGYKHMKPVVYAEDYIEQADGQVYDYKFFAFNGKVEFLFVATDRNVSNQLTYDFFDCDYNHLPFTYGGGLHANPLPEKPKNYDKMIELAEKLAKPFPFVRVDFYEIGDEIFVGEMTFYSGGGILPITPREWDYKLGEYFKLPEKLITDKQDDTKSLKYLTSKVKWKAKRKLRSIRSKVVRHDVIARKHYVTVFNRIRFPFEVHEEKGYKYVDINGAEIKYKKLEDQPDRVLPDWEFDVLSPKIAYMMEDKITIDMKKHYCEQKAYKQLRYFPNLDQPKSFNEKLLWLALHYKNPHHSIASDKYRAKQWVAERIGEEHVVPLIGAYSNVNDIDFKNLPKQFVVKANCGWGAGQVIIVRDKSSCNIDKLKAICSSWLFPWSSYYYNNMCITDEKPERPMIVIEEFLEQKGQDDLDDYKLYVCNGKVKFVLVVNDRGNTSQKRTYVDADWNVLPVRRAGKFVSEAPERPDNFDEMIRLAERLAEEVPFARVDFYNVDGKLYLGEMTFTPGLFLRFEPRSWDYRLGEYLDISSLVQEYEDERIKTIIL